MSTIKRIMWPPVVGSRVLHADGEEREIVAVFRHNEQVLAVTAHRYGGPRSRWIYETFGQSAAEVGLLRDPER